MPGQFLVRPGRPGRLAVRSGSGDPIDHDGEAEAAKLRLLADHGADGLADLVIGGLVGLLFLRPASAGLGFGVGQVVLHRDVRRRFRGAAAVGAVLLTADHLAVWVVFLLDFAHLVEVEIDGGLGADVARA